jgi:hypothetical protein
LCWWCCLRASARAIDARGRRCAGAATACSGLGACRGDWRLWLHSLLLYGSSWV